MRKIIDWLKGWTVTLDIMLFDRELYRTLRDWEVDPEWVPLDEYFEAGPPPETWRRPHP